MILDAILQYLHISAILALVVFISSEAALCRPQWMNAQVVQRLVVVDRIYGIAAGVVLATGLIRIYLGTKGASWYWHNWLLHVKLTLFIVVGLISILPTIRFIRWNKALKADGSLPVYRPAVGGGVDLGVQMGSGGARVSIEKARKLLGYQPPVPTERALELTLEWTKYARIVG